MPELTTTGPAVATSHPLSAAAGVEMFTAGGNAVDAAVAAMLANCVVVPYSVSIGGYGGSLVYFDAAKGAVSAVDFDSRAPYAFKPDGEKDVARWNVGYLAVSVPGVVAGLSLALEMFGTKKWADVIAPAVRLADEGFVVTATGAKTIAGFAIRSDKTSIKAMAPTGKFPATGERWVQKDLANLLRKLAEDPRSLYHGDIPRAIVKQVRANGGILAEEDFSRYEARVVEPLTVRYHGVDLYVPPPPSEGVTVLGILKTLESFDLAEREPWGAPYFELYAEAAKLCWDERREHLGDPDFVKVPLAEMLSEQSALSRAERIRKGPPRDGRPVPKDDGGHTATAIAVGADRSLCAVTATNGGGWGARVAIEGLGLPLAHGMSRFTWNDPSSPNRAEPGKRVLHNMAPLVMLKSGKPLGLVGIVGGKRIPSATAQVVIGLLDFKKTPAQTLDAPRLHTEGDEPLEVTKNLPESVFDELQLMGHKVKRVAGIGGPLNCGILSEDGKLTIAGTIAGGVADASK